MIFVKNYYLWREILNKKNGFFRNYQVHIAFAHSFSMRLSHYKAISYTRGTKTKMGTRNGQPENHHTA